ncbi:protein Shroom4 [Manacus vitellinus]|uniref:protein Shroom4 n=1 Tax=Manacus vitellinus TaxID=328815 RepID=UPI00115F3EB9|nr:protein Shroom4 [Manacus vitellinus]
MELNQRHIPWDVLGAVPPLTPLSVAQVEDGGKAALSRRLQPGDELVNISGTPLYGSRQEALILIKGSYRTLKMIVRRRSVPVLRPHSWHVAKLAESRPDAPTMHCPADAFSLSWPSGCDVSELSLQWNPLSRHCSTDRSSSIGSMESLDHPGQAYYEGDPSPVDQGMYHSKRDSAYSSFSASSIASDCALSLRPEEAVSTDSSFQGAYKAPDGRYLTTGAEPSASRHPEAWRAPVPPQPPVRRDSLRAAPGSRGDRHRASVSADMLHAKGRWISDTFLCQRDGEAEAVGGRTLAPYPTKDRLSADQYYMLSSHPDQCPAEPLLGESMESDDRLYLDGSMHRVLDATTAGDNPLLSPLKGHVPHRHSAPEQLLASQLRSLQGGRSWGHAARPPAPPGAWPRPEPPGSLRRTPGPDVGNAEICRVAGAGEKRPKAKKPWEMEEQPQRLIRNPERGCAGPCGVGECSPPLPGGPSPAVPEALKPSPGAAEGVSCQGSRPQPRRVDSEELLWNVAVRDHSLANVHAPLAPFGTTTEVIGELLVAGERQAWRERLQQDWHLEALAQDRQGFEPISPPPGSVASSSSFPVHYTAAAGKAEPLSKVTALPEVVEGSSEDDDDEEVDQELVEKKLQLIESLSRKLAVLREAQRGLQEDISANGALGDDVSARLQALCTPGEFDKYRLFVGDLDKVVNLLLSLSGRLARVEAALGSLGPHAPAEDKLALREKRRLLVAQLEDAKELKEHVGRREEAVGAMVARYLPAEHLQDYQHFVKMKSALIAEQRELEEKIKLGQEQLRCLRESLGQASKGC